MLLSEALLEADAASAISGDPVLAANVADLRYVHGDGPGLRRVRSPRGVIYLDNRGRRVRAEATLERIRRLAIPPAWADVCICPDPRGHVQAWGRDARGRKQYRYHPRWREVRDSAKYTRLLRFAMALPRIRARVAGDLRTPGLSREKVLATVVRLLEATMIRIGNEEYARTNGTFGLTTMRRRHVGVTASTLRFEFRGKSGRHHTVDVTDRRLARIVRRCQELPGQELFKYIADDGSRQAVDSDTVNAYLREISGEDFTAKDFRTWAGTVLALDILRTLPHPAGARAAKGFVRQAIAQIAGQLGNTPAVCRKCYVHPVVIEAYMAGMLIRIRADRPPDSRTGVGLTHSERQVVRVLRKAA